MICPIDSPKYYKFFGIVYKMLRNHEATGKPFVFKDFAKSVHDAILSTKPEDSQRALLYTQMVPQMVIAAYGQAPDLGEYLSEKGLDLGKIAQAKKAFKDIDNVAKYLGRVTDAVAVVKKAEKEREDQVNSAPIPKQSQPATERPQGKFTAKRSTMLSTTGQDAKGETLEEQKLNIPDERAIPYSNFQKNIVSEILSSGVNSNELTITGTKKVKGIYLTAMLGSNIPDTHMHPRTKERLENGKLKREDYNNTVVFAITDQDGNFLYFDDNNQITTAKNGRLMLYDMRSSDTAKIQTAQEIARNKGITVEAAEALIADGVKSNEAVKAYLAKNPKAKVKTIINGGTKGYVTKDRTKPVVVSTIDFQGNKPEISIIKDPSKSRNFWFIHVQGIEEPFQLNESLITSEDADMISNFITSKVYQKVAGGKEKQLTANEKANYLAPILWNGHIKALLEFNDKPDMKQLAYERLTKPFAGDSKVRSPKEGVKQWEAGEEGIDGVIPSNASYIKATKNGETGIYFLQKIFYNINDAVKNKGVYDKIELKARKDGSFDLTTDTSNPSDYESWIHDHTTTNVELNANNQIVTLNPSFDYTYDQKDLDKALGVQEATEQAITQAKTKKAAPAVAPIDQPKLTNSSVLDILKKENLYKRFYQKEGNVKATLEQLEDAKKWWSTGPLSKHISFEAMFNIINTARPDTVAEWSSHGIVLYKGSDYSDLYHEAWHGFTQLFLTKAEKTKLYDETRKLSGTFTDYEGKRVEFARASELQIEEYIAEEFRSFMLNGGKALANPVKNNIFQRILNFLKNLFKGLTTKDVVLNPEATYMKELFDKLRVGDINEFTFDMNNRNFAILNKGLQQLGQDKTKVPQLSLTASKMINDTVNYLVSDITNQINAGINIDEDWEKIKKNYDMIFPNLESEEFNEFREASKIAAPSSREYVTEGLLLKNDITRGYVYGKVLSKLTKIRADVYKEYEAASEGPTKQRFADYLQSIDYAIDEFGDHTKQVNFLKGKGTIAYNLQKSPFLTSADKSEIYEALEEDEKDEGYEKRGNAIPIELMFDPKVTSFLKGLHPVDKEGKPVLNELGVPKPINFKFVVNRLSRVLGNGISKDGMYKILNEKRDSEPLFNQILNRLGPLNTSDDKAHDIQTLLWSGFNLSNVNLIQLTKNQDQVDNTFETTFGIASSPTDTIRRNWESTFSMATSDTIKKTPEGISQLDLKAFFTKYPNWVDGKEIEILHAMGIPISDDPAGIIRKRLSQRSTAGYYGVGHIYNSLKAAYVLQQDGQYIKLTSIRDITGDLGTKEQRAKNKDLQNNEGRYSNILDLEAKYNETAGHTVSNASGDPVQDLTVNNFQTIVKDSINSVESWEELMAIPEMSYLARNKNFLAKYSRILSSIFDFSKGGNRRLDKNGIEINKNRYVEFKLENFAGIALTEDGYHLNGMAITDLNIYDSLMAYLDSFVMAGKPLGPGHGAKSSTFLYSTKTIAKKASTPHSGEQYVDIAHFLHSKDTPESTGRDLANAILIDYINGELNRIHAFNALPEKSPLRYSYKRGGEFNFFSDVLSENTKKKLIAIKEIEKDSNFTLEHYFHPDNVTEQGKVLYDAIITDLDNYFQVQINDVSSMFNKTIFGSQSLTDKVLTSSTEALRTEAYKNKEGMPQAILEAFVYNTWMHSFEGRAIFYGDLAQFAKPQDTGKRDGAMASPGIMFDYSQSGINFINGKGKNSRPYGYSKWNPNHESYVHKAFSNIMNAAVLQDPVTASEYIKDNIRPAFEEELASIRNSPLTAEEKAERVALTIKAYEDMKIADSAGIVSFDTYRLLRISNGTWSDPKLELTFQKVLRGEDVNFREMATMFHTLKLQYSGPLSTDNLPLMANHKFMVVPLIPTMIKGKKWETFHNEMIKQNIDYALFQSGSKTGTLTKNGNADPFYTDLKTKEIAFDKPKFKFTPNPIYLKYLKEQTATSDEYDGKGTTSRQLRTLAISDIMDAGAPIDFMPKSSNHKRDAEWNKMKEDTKKNVSDLYRMMKDYESNLNEKTRILKENLKKKMGWIEGDSEANMKKLLEFVHNELQRKDLPEHLVDYVEYNPSTRTPLRQLSLSLNGEDIENLLTNLVSKIIVNQKSNGQAYYMVSDVGHEYSGSAEALPFYKRGEIDKATGKRRETSMAGCRVALHGDFMKLLKLRHPDGRRVGTIERLNKLIRSESWLSKDHNRDMVSFVGIRIPGQGLDSVDIVQIYEFLPTESGPVIMMHPEVVAKVGADYDNDKFPAMIPNIMVINGEVQYGRNYSKAEGLDIYNKVVKARVAIDKLKDSEGWKVSVKKKITKGDTSRIDEDLTVYNNVVLAIFNEGKKPTDGDYIHDMSDITDIEVEEAMLEEGKLLPYDEFFKKINGVKAVENRIINNIKDLALLPENYGQLVKPNGTFLLKPITEEKLKPYIEEFNFNKNIQATNEGFNPTRIMEIPYNLNKVTGITAAQQALGITMVGLRWSPLFNRVGFRLNSSYDVVSKKGKEYGKKDLTLYFPHNYYIAADGKHQISLSHVYNVVGTRISDLISQLSNGNVDAESDDWAANMQANREATPVIVQMLKSGVDQELVQYFVSNPLVRAYLQEQREARGPHSRQLGKAPKDESGNIQPNFYRGEAMKNILSHPQYGFNVQFTEFNKPNSAPGKMMMYGMLQGLMKGKQSFESLLDELGAKKVSKGMLKINGQHYFIKNTYWKVEGKVGRNELFFYPESGEEIYIGSAKEGSDDFQVENNTFDRGPKVGFTKEALFDSIKNASKKTIGLDYQITDLDKAAFLHYLDIEEMARATRDITMRLTGDTKRSKSLSNAWNRKALISELSNNKMFDGKYIEKLLTDSPISSFDSNQFIMDALMPLFRLRAHPAVLEYIGNKQKQEAFGQVPDITKSPEDFGPMFINDFIGGYMFQNLIRGFNINSVKNYKGFGVTGALPVQEVRSLKFGAFVEKGTMYVDKKSLATDVAYKLFANEEVYGKRGLATVDADAFDSSDEYYHFVFEREYLRSITSDKAKELAKTPIAYEEFLRDEALDNTFNMWKIFKSEDSFASQFQEIKKDIELVARYPVLQALIVDSERNNKGEIVPNGIKNIRLSTIQLTKDEKDTYHEQLLELANISKPKSTDPENNKKITRFFKRMPFVAMLQSGMSTDNQFSYTSIVPQNEINRLMEQESDKWIKLFDAMLDRKAPSTQLDIYYEKFYDNNKYSNRSKYRMKDYLLTEEDKKAVIGTTERLADLFTPLMYAVEEANLNLEMEPLQKLAKANPDKVFVWGAAKKVDSAVSNRKDDKVKAKDSFLKDVDNSFPLTVRENNGIGQGPMLHLSDDELEQNKKLIENSIEGLKKLRDSGKTLVFNSEGYGQALVGADDITGKNIDLARAHAPETFRYLSQRLFEEFNYINKNMMYTKQGRSIIQKTQPISDDAVRDKLISCFT
jgi:hypothetical protein